jgi:hypothetical protein
MQKSKPRSCYILLHATVAAGNPVSAGPSMMPSNATASSLTSSTAVFLPPRAALAMEPNLGGEDIVMNSVCTGSFADARRRAEKEGWIGKQAGGRGPRWVTKVDIPSLAISSRIPPPPTSNTTRPTGTLEYDNTRSIHDEKQANGRICDNSTNLQAQYSKAPFPLPIRVSFPFTQTGTSGKTLIQHSAPLTGLIFRLTATSAEESCLAVRRVPSSSRRPYVPSCSVVPFVDPP